jgi:hypothetical protein
MWDRWPQQRLGVRAYMQSTYDRTGGNEAADASHFLYQLADDRNVTIDVTGKGLLYFCRYNHWHGSPWHYEVDGRDFVVVESSTATPTTPVRNATFLPQEAFPAPLALTWADTRGSDLSWVPISFEHSFRMMYGRTHYGTGNYIYHLFAPGIELSRTLDAWTPNHRPSVGLLDLLRSVGTDIAPPADGKNVRQVNGQLRLGSDKTVLAWKHAGQPATIRMLRLYIPKQDAVTLSEVRLRITWDERDHPSIDVPLALFFGAGIFYNRDAKEFLVKSFPMTVRYVESRIELSCYFPMPYFQSVLFELLTPKGCPEVDVEWSVRIGPLHGEPRHSSYFHATYRDQNEAPPFPSGDGYGADMVLLDTRKVEGGGHWAGNFVGTSIIFSDHGVLSTLEGDPRFFFDDSLTPQVQGTGTEEWCGGGDYFGGETMTLPFVGHPVGAKSRDDAVRSEDKVEAAYRFLLADLMPFGRNALIQLERGGDDESDQHYRTVAYWYGLPSPSLILTDKFSVGDEPDERAHRYHSPTASSPYDIMSRYCWGPDSFADGSIEIYPATKDRGRKMTGTSRFEMQVDPENWGVLLRRKLDYEVPNQCADIFISTNSSETDWSFAGTWSSPGSSQVVYSNGVGELGKTEHNAESSNRRFRDEEFLIPPALSRGHSKLTLEVRFRPRPIPLFPGADIPELAWTELNYTAYSIVEPNFNLQLSRRN